MEIELTHVNWEMAMKQAESALKEALMNVEMFQKTYAHAKAKYEELKPEEPESIELMEE